jgi:hypothetical protein
MKTTDLSDRGETLELLTLRRLRMLFGVVNP